MPPGRTEGLKNTKIKCWPLTSYVTSNIYWFVVVRFFRYVFSTTYVMWRRIILYLRTVLYKQDRQCTYKSNEVHMRNHIYCAEAEVLHTPSVCLYPLLYNMYSTYAILFYLWQFRLYHVFPHCLINSKIFGKSII
jgi:hypothetical protein